MKKSTLTEYLLWSFGAAWILQIIAGLLFRQGNRTAYSALLSLAMFTPLLAAAVTRPGLRQLGWKPCIKKNIGWFLSAWFLPAVMGTVGAALYFLITPGAWDLSFAYVRASLGAEGVQQLESSGLSLKMYAVISIVSAVAYAPFINMLLAVGEEAGWRGTMYPMLKERLGMTKGRIVGGVIWGIWHWPIMFLAGYEYGTAYWGAPVTGPLLFCVITTAMGILFDLSYEKNRMRLGARAVSRRDQCLCRCPGIFSGSRICGQTAAGAADGWPYRGLAAHCRSRRCLHICRQGSGCGKTDEAKHGKKPPTEFQAIIPIVNSTAGA